MSVTGQLKQAFERQCQNQGHRKHQGHVVELCDISRMNCATSLDHDADTAMYFSYATFHGRVLIILLLIKMFH